MSDLLTALTSGSVAAVVTLVITYPLDFSKTQRQLNNQSQMAKYHVPNNSAQTLAQVYRGSSVLVAGNLVKSLARLILYNWATKFMAIEGHQDGTTKLKTSAPRLVIAGAMSGCLETFIIVPFENVKIAMIQNMSLQNEIANSPNRNVTGIHTHSHSGYSKGGGNVFSRQYVSPNAYYTSDLMGKLGGDKHTAALDKLKRKFNAHPASTMRGTIAELYALKGLQGFLAGTWITVFRQVMISTVWTSTYNASKQLLDPSLSLNNVSLSEPQWFGHKHTALQLLGLHFIAAVAVVAATQPIDVVKSHRQLKNAQIAYKDALSTAYKLFLKQGPMKLWSGALPRGIKVFVSGGLTATIYGYVDGFLTAAVGQTVFPLS